MHERADGRSRNRRAGHRPAGQPAQARLSRRRPARVQYQLDDPDEYAARPSSWSARATRRSRTRSRSRNTTASSSSIARRSSRAARRQRPRPEAIKEGRIECHYNSAPEAWMRCRMAVKGRTFVKTPARGADRLRSHHRAPGRDPAAQARRGFRHQFPEQGPGAVPAISPQYESNVKGLYIIGALGGYPLIKQAMNQGYEVVEFVLGARSRRPTSRCSRRSSPCRVPQRRRSAASACSRTCRCSGTSRRCSCASSCSRGRCARRRQDESSSSATTTPTPSSIVDGEVRSCTTRKPEGGVTLGRGQFFGEMGLISGRRRSATVHAGRDCVLMEAPRRSMPADRLRRSVKREIDEAFLMRAVRRISRRSAVAELDDVAAAASWKNSRPATSCSAKASPASLHLIRRGSVTISRTSAARKSCCHTSPPATTSARWRCSPNRCARDGARGGRDRNGAPRRRRFQAARQRATRLCACRPSTACARRRTWRCRRSRSAATSSPSSCAGRRRGDRRAADRRVALHPLRQLREGVRRRARRHVAPGSRGRAHVREIHVPTSCRHCEHPHCMKECPPDAIHRSPNGEVFIADNCIGCGNCERNCPYGVIHMAAKPPKKPGLLMAAVRPRQRPGEAPYEKEQGRPAERRKRSSATCAKTSPAGRPACARARPVRRSASVPKNFPRMRSRVASVSQTMHDSILTYAKSRYLWISLILLLGSIAAYLWHDPGGPPTAARGSATRSARSARCSSCG